MNRQKKTLLLLIDLFVLVLCLLFVARLRDGVPEEKVLFSLGTWFITLTVILLYYIFGSFDLTATTSLRRIFARIVFALGLSLALIVLVNYFGGKERTGVFGRIVLFGSFTTFACISGFYRWLVVSFLKQQVKKSRWLFVVTSSLFEKLEQDLRKNLFQGQRFYLLNTIETPSNPLVLGTWDDLNTHMKESWSQVVLSLDSQAPQKVIEELIAARFENVNVKDLIQFYEQQWRKIPLFALQSHWFLQTDGFQLFGNPIRVRLKRLLDILISTVMILICFPIMALTAVLIKLTSVGPVVYCQSRTGKDGKDFVLYKFRSMKVDAEVHGAQWAQANDTRITSIGKLIRKTRIDELPQLFNIIQGNMSLVGPRPERPEFNEMLKKKIPFYQFRHIMHPGLTGWAQVLYPYGASIEDAEEKLKYELYYIKNYSLWFDFAILLKTIQVVLFGKGR